MPYEYVDLDKAPTPPAKKPGGSAAYFAEIIENLPLDKVASITPDEGQTVRGIKVSVGRVASKRHIPIQSWDQDGVVYVKRLES